MLSWFEFAQQIIPKQKAFNKKKGKKKKMERETTLFQGEKGNAELNAFEALGLDNSLNGLVINKQLFSYKTFFFFKSKRLNG